MLLVSIAGDFHSSIFPLYNDFKDKIHYHLVVDDDAFNKKRKLRKIVDSLKEFNTKHNLKFITQEFKIDEDSLQSIKKLTSYIQKLEPDPSKIYINATDGLANIGIALAARLLPKGVKFISYDMHENSYNITTQNNIKTCKIKGSLSIEDHFLLKGLSITQKGNKEFAHKYQKQILELFNNHANEMELLNKDITNQNTHHKTEYPRALQLVKSMGLDEQRDIPLITGGLFEYYIYLLIKDMGFDDIEIGIKIKQPLNNIIGVENEFDILLMKNNHLHMIECKFRKMKKRDIVYKYASLINLIDDDSMMMILTNDDVYNHDIYDTKRVELSDYRRAFLNRIAIRGSAIKNQQLFLDEIVTLFLNGF